MKRWGIGLTVQREVMEEFPGHEPRQRTRAEGALFHRLRRMGRTDACKGPLNL